MTSHSHSTTDHDEIRHWVEQHQGKPAHVRDTADSDNDPGVLRVAFTDDDEQLENITWDEWFDKFDAAKLAFLYQSETTGGSDSRFFKLVNR